METTRCLATTILLLPGNNETACRWTNAAINQQLSRDIVIANLCCPYFKSLFS